MKKVLITGAGGFIGGHLSKYYSSTEYDVTCVDIKPLNQWYQVFDNNKNIQADLKYLDKCLEITKGIDFIFNLACNMGGMGFIELNKAECMLSVLINSNLLYSSKINKIKKYFYTSSACVYNAQKQTNPNIDGLKEEDAYPADPEDGYGWEKLFSERMCRHFMEDYNIPVRVARYHNIYGPYGTFDGGREKAPAALCRKVIKAKKNNENKIEVWGDGKQTRTFLYIDDCIEGTLRLFESDYSEPVNIGSDEQVSINQMIDIIEDISKTKKLKREYQLDKPKGVRGRSSNNDLVKNVLNWSFKIKLKDGLEKTYNWINNEMNKHGSNISRFTKS